MKILQINAVNQYGSTGRNMKEKKEYLNTHGIECHTAYSAGIPDDSDYRIGNIFEEKLHALMSRVTGLQGYYSFFATRKLIRHIQAYMPDVVELNNLHANYINLDMLFEFLAKNDIATFAVLHDCWFYTGKCCHYTKNRCYKWQSGCGGCKYIHQNNNSFFFDHTAKMWNDKKKWFSSIPRLGVIGVSDWILSEAGISDIFKHAKLFARIYNWIDTDVFTPQIASEEVREKLGLTNRFMILCVSSRWGKNKGIDDIIHIANLLRDEAAIVLVGNASGLTGLPDNILKVGVVSETDNLARYYAAADVFLNMSREESFGKVSAEALACGTPVIAYDGTANAELVHDPSFLIPAGDTDAVIRSIRKVRSFEKKHFTESCVNFARTRFAKDICLQQYIQEYNTLINGQGWTDNEK